MIEMEGLDGSNPLGFFAALGALVVGDRLCNGVRLTWSDDVRPHAVLHGFDQVDDFVDTVMNDRDAWSNSPALDYPAEDPWGDVKVGRDDLRSWISACQDARPSDSGRAVSLASALVAEGSTVASGDAKPSDLHFTAGQQQILSMMREVRDGVDADHVRSAVNGPWSYESKLPSMMWDVSDDRVYALSATNPAKDKKLTEPGAEWLAVMGLTALAVAGAPGRTLTPGGFGSWKSGHFTWCLWHDPLTLPVVRSLLVSREIAEADEARLRARGIDRVFRCRITRSEQGGYGSFRPPTIVADVASA